ncbi:hypothetical protein TNCV_4824131 [Trichonephila clavipes]|nr:hypothetical protein TNCV_4824131 [Trichonephila clavipes]
MTSKKTGKDMPLFLILLDKTEQNRATYHVTDIGYMMVKVEALRPKPKCCLCEGEHPASFLGCPQNPRNKVEKEKTSNKDATKPTKVADNTPAPPKVNFWEQRAKNAASRQQSNPNTSKKSSQAPPSLLVTFLNISTPLQ